MKLSSRETVGVWVFLFAGFIGAGYFGSREAMRENKEDRFAAFDACREEHDDRYCLPLLPPPDAESIRADITEYELEEQDLSRDSRIAH